jgi:cellulose synthase/poly-beta-1,6-N-acetylglucosamine synthase-like glycosyltransferase
VLLLVIDLIAFLCLAVQFIIAAYFLYLVYWSIELPPADGTVPALPDKLPRVLVQIPVYNEPLVIDRVLGAAAALDWPRDRLVVQLLDDSTDITSDIAVHAVARLRRDGVDVAHIRRDDRSTPTSCRSRVGCAAPWQPCWPSRAPPSCRPASNGATARRTG